MASQSATFLNPSTEAFQYRPNIICPACDKTLSCIIDHASKLHANQTGSIYYGLLDGLNFTFSDIATSARLGCHFCQIMAAHLTIDYRDVKADENISISLDWDAGPDNEKESWEQLHIYVHPRGKRCCQSLLFLQASKNKLVDLKPEWAEFDTKVVKEPPMSYRTDSQEMFQIARNWLEECLREHPFCDKRSISTQRPSRLLFLERADSNMDPVVKLVEAAETGDRPYVTLSHCWGLAQIITTTQENEKRYKKDIEFGTLSRTFQDAIKITLELGYNLIWIDSLCIVQDSIEDWSKESKIMGSIYANAVVTIAALDSKEGSGGCFSYNRHPLGFRMLELPHKDLTVISDGWQHWWTCLGDMGGTVSPLHQRAWVVQERYLSPRTLYYGIQGILWECRSSKATENWSQTNSEPLNSEFPKTSFRNESSMDYSETHDVQGIWMGLLENYATCKMSKPTDRLVAITGLILELEQRSGLDCFLGIWTHDLPKMLLWNRRHELTEDGSQYAVESHTTRIENGLPTWTWASIMGPIHYYNEDKRDKIHWQASIDLQRAYKMVKIRSVRRKVIILDNNSKPGYWTIAFDPEDKQPETEQTAKIKNLCATCFDLHQAKGSYNEGCEWMKSRSSYSDTGRPHIGGEVERDLWAVPLKITESWPMTEKANLGSVDAHCLILTTLDSVRADARNNGEAYIGDVHLQERVGLLYHRIGYAHFSGPSGDMPLTKRITFEAQNYGQRRKTVSICPEACTNVYIR